MTIGKILAHMRKTRYADAQKMILLEQGFVSALRKHALSSSVKIDHVNDPRCVFRGEGCTALGEDFPRDPSDNFVTLLLRRSRQGLSKRS